MKINKSIYILLFTLTLFSLTACQKQPTAEEINESIAAQKESQAIQQQESQQANSEAQAKEDEKFQTKSDAVLERESQEAHKEEVLASKDEIKAQAEENRQYSILDTDDPEKIAEAESKANASLDEALFALNDTPAADIDTAVDIAINDTSEDYEEPWELEDGAWFAIDRGIQQSVTPEYAYKGTYANLEAVYADIDKIYASHSENARNSLKALAKDHWEYYTEYNKQQAADPDHWTEEELDEDPTRLHYTRAESHADEGVEFTDDMWGTYAN